MKNLNVLIVEDELIIYVHLKQTLTKLGLQHIHIAKDAKSAFEIAGKVKIDILFSDINIQGDTDGIETARTLQNLYKMPVVFITAYKDQDTLLRASEVDFIGYLLKPYRVDELEALIKLAIAKYELINNSNSFIAINPYKFDKTKNRLLKDNQELKLSKKEQLFVALMFNSKGTIVPYDIIDETIWHENFVSESTRRTFIHRVKNKLTGLEFQIEKSVGIGLL